MINSKVWTKKELEKLPDAELFEEPPVLDEIYVISDSKNHSSEFKFLNIYGVTKDGKYAKKLSSFSDVLHFYIKPAKTAYDPKMGNYYYKIDYKEQNVMRLFGAKFTVDGVGFSDFSISVSKER